MCKTVSRDDDDGNNNNNNNNNNLLFIRHIAFKYDLMRTNKRPFFHIPIPSQWISLEFPLKA